jgi:adenosylcobyric acid synthase
MPAKTIMIQGTASSAGKSIIVAGLCRLFSDAGYRVAPFKSQNMALNSSVTADGYEISRSQTMQAEAARVAPQVEMNPVLLKPKGELRAQVILKGKPYGDFGARQYREQVTPAAFETAKECLAVLRHDFDVVVIEGAGSPAEVNLKAQDISNMKVAAYADAPVLLVGDIDRGGCLAAIVGTLELLEPEERGRIKGLIINKFRGDLSLLQPGLDFLTERTGIPVLGVLPYLKLDLPEEDSMGLPERSGQPMASDASKLVVGVIRLPRIANFTDIDALAGEPDVVIRFVEKAVELEDCDLIIIPGTKNTTADLAWLRANGLAEQIRALAGAAFIFGICGGYQMLGEEVHDPHHLESDCERIEGLGLLPLITRFESMQKTLRQVKGSWRSGSGKIVPVVGYEIHQGITEIKSKANLFQLESGGREGCRAGNVIGTYLHGCFDSDEFRHAFLNEIRLQKGLPLPQGSRSLQASREAGYQLLAEALRQNLDMKRVYEIVGLSGPC